MEVPLMIIPLKIGVRLAGKEKAIWSRAFKFYPKLKLYLMETDLEVEAEEYIGASFISALATGLLFASLVYLLLTVLGAEQDKVLFLTGSVGLVIFLLFLFVLITYPNILAGKKAEQIERDLVFALKDMLLEVSSGASPYAALTEVANSDYGSISREIGKVVNKANVGIPVEEALEDLAVRTRSEMLKNSIWQIVNALKSGSSLEGILRELVRDLTVEQKMKIRNYAQELNVMVLIYMLFAVVIPTIATTLIIVLGPFLGIDMGPKVFYIILPVCFFIQISLMEFIKSRRPVVYV
ncbi:MAG: type II secretion system F family protein [Candidatus Altiarchaeota archaeon]